MEMTMTKLFTTAAFTLALLGFRGEQERHPDNDWFELNQPWTEIQV